MSATPLTLSYPTPWISSTSTIPTSRTRSRHGGCMQAESTGRVRAGTSMVVATRGSRLALMWGAHSRAEWRLGWTLYEARVRRGGLGWWVCGEMRRRVRGFGQGGVGILSGNCYLIIVRCLVKKSGIYAFSKIVPKVEVFSLARTLEPHQTAYMRARTTRVSPLSVKYIFIHCTNSIHVGAEAKFTFVFQKSFVYKFPNLVKHLEKLILTPHFSKENVDVALDVK